MYVCMYVCMYVILCMYIFMGRLSFDLFVSWQWVLTLLSLYFHLLKLIVAPKGADGCEKVRPIQSLLG